MSNKVSKTLWHGELVKKSPVTAKILSEPTESKFPDRPKWVVLEIDGEERFLNCENTSVELALAGLKGQWTRLNAKGRGEDATIEVNEAEGKPKPEVREEKPASAKEEIKRHDGTGDIKTYAAHSLRVLAEAWETSKGLMALIPEMDAKELSAAQWLDLRLRVAQGIAIEVNKILRKERF